MTSVQIHDVLYNVSLALLPVLLAFGVGLLNKLLAKYHLQISQGEAAKAEFFTRQAISYVAELKAARAKSSLGPMTATDALSTAVNFLMRNTNVDQSKALDLIHAVLPTTTQGAAASAVIGPLVKAQS